MSYEDFGTLDFLADPEFRNWVLDPNLNSNEFWDKWIAAHPEQRETIILAREILLSFEYEKAEKIEESEKGEILTAILGKSTAKQKKVIPSKGYVYAVAASLLLLFAAGALLYTSTTEIESDPVAEISWIEKSNPKGQKSMITLPDGSSVWLNSESAITYKSDFTDERLIKLEGEAFFEVVKKEKRPFKVSCRGIITTALGTSFNIRAFNGEPFVSVGLVTGEVSVETSLDSTASKLFISPGQMAMYNTEVEELNTTTYDNLDFIKWTKKTIVFKQATLPEIKNELERWYGVEIYFNNRKLPQKKYTGEFFNESLDRVLERLAYSENFNFTMKDNEVFIEFK